MLQHETTTTYTCTNGPCPGWLSDGKNQHKLNGLQSAAIVVVSVLIVLVVVYRCAKWLAAEQHYMVVSDHVMRNATVERFVLEMAEEKPIRFTAEQLAGFTRNYSMRLGAGGFGTVYRGALPNGLAVAVKVLHHGLDTKTSEEQFMAEMGTIGRTHHINLVRLYGFCFDGDATRALVYEFMEHGSLEDYLSCGVNMSRGLRYLHEECQDKIVHYDIKPSNVLLDGTLTPKVTDFGLARLNRADTHVSLSCERGTPGYAAPEVWMELRITEKCDVCSFGMLEGEMEIRALPNRFEYQMEPPAANLRMAMASTVSVNTSNEIIIGIIGIILLLLLGVLRFFGFCSVQRLRETSVLTDVMRNATSLATDVMRNATVEGFLLEMAKEKPIRFTPDQLIGFTRNYATRLGAGGFGTVYRGTLPNGLAVAVKVLHPGLDTKTSEEQFMAEMGTIGRTHHINLIRLYGFCFDGDATRALVYEFMEHGSLDDYLSCGVSMTTVAAVATGVARGLRYLHEECQHKIVHYDIKPGNVLLDGALTPKVADFGLARLVNRADTHVSMSRGRGTAGYAAPEVWMELRITEKCDVYSFGMLLLKIVRRGSSFNAQDAAPGSESSQPWFPMVAWTRYEAGGLMELVLQTDVDDSRSRELVKRMCKVAFWCVQQRPPARPSMSVVVKMLEGEMEIPPPPNPFQYLMESSAVNLRMAMASTVSVNTSNEIISF